MQHRSTRGVNPSLLQTLHSAAFQCLRAFPPVLRGGHFKRLPELLTQQRHQIRGDMSAVARLKLFKIRGGTHQVCALRRRKRQLKQCIRPVFALHANHAQIRPRRFFLAAHFVICLRKFPFQRLACAVLILRFSKQCHRFVISSGKAVLMRAADPVFTCARHRNHLGHDTPPVHASPSPRCACVSRLSSSSPLKR